MRTEEQKLTMAPIEMKFGGEVYKVPPLKMGDAITWRAKLAEALTPIMDNFQQATGKVSDGMAQAVTQFPEVMTKLILDYDLSKVINRERMMSEGTEEQLVAAWSDLMTVAYPFLVPLMMVTQIVRPKPSR